MHFPLRDSGLRHLALADSPVSDRCGGQGTDRGAICPLLSAGSQLAFALKAEEEVEDLRLPYPMDGAIRVVLGELPDPPEVSEIAALA